MQVTHGCEGLRVVDASIMIAGIGVAVPGILDRQGRISELTPTQRHIPFKALGDGLRARRDVPVYLENDGPAYAEAIAPGAPRDSLFYLIIDHGIGGKIVTGRRMANRHPRCRLPVLLGLQGATGGV